MLNMLAAFISFSNWGVWPGIGQANDLINIMMASVVFDSNPNQFSTSRGELICDDSFTIH